MSGATCAIFMITLCSPLTHTNTCNAAKFQYTRMSIAFADDLPKRLARPCSDHAQSKALTF